MNVLEGLLTYLSTKLGKNDDDAILIDNDNQSIQELKDIFPNNNVFQDRNDYERIYSLFCELLENSGQVEETMVEGLYTTSIN